MTEPEYITLEVMSNGLPFLVRSLSDLRLVEASLLNLSQEDMGIKRID